MLDSELFNSLLKNETDKIGFGMNYEFRKKFVTMFVFSSTAPSLSSFFFIPLILFIIIFILLQSNPPA